MPSASSAPPSDSPARRPLWRRVLGRVSGRVSGWDLLSVLVLAAVVVAHVRFIFQDTRLPRDLGQYYKALPDLFVAVQEPLDHLNLLWDNFSKTGGWYNIFLALAMFVVGRSPYHFQLVDVWMVGIVLLLSALVGRRVAGPRGGVVAMALMGGFPMVVVVGRSAWIHLPEMVLLLSVMALFLRDEGLDSWFTVAGVSILGWFALALRPSALIWMASFGLFFVRALRLRGRRRLLRMLVILLFWGLGIVVVARGLGGYLEAKLAARERYELQVPELWEQIKVALGWSAGGVGVVGMWFGLFGKGRWELKGILLFWVVFPLALTAFFNAGLDNFTAICVGLAVLTGMGLARWRWGLGVVVALVAFGLAYAPQWVPEQAPTSRLAQVAARFGVHFRAQALDYRRPYHGFGGSEVVMLVLATCPDAMGEAPGDSSADETEDTGLELEPVGRELERDEIEAREGSCHILVDQGLFQPYSEDPGDLELFVTGLDEVQIWETRMPPKALEKIKPDALAQFDCGEKDKLWRQRYPHSLTNLFEVMDEYEFQTVWRTQWGTECLFQWMTPGGEVEAPRLLPYQGARGVPSQGLTTPPPAGGAMGGGMTPTPPPPQGGMPGSPGGSMPQPSGGMPGVPQGAPGGTGPGGTVPAVPPGEQGGG